MTHGDQFDLVVRHARWLALLGDGAYTAALFLNTYLNVARRKLGFDVLVALSPGKGPREERGQLHRAL